MFFGQGVSCVTATSNGALSGSITYGSVDWEYQLFTGSVYADVTQYQFSILSGSTSQAKVFVLGGGGGGGANATVGTGGGAGGIRFVNNVFLRPTLGTDFYIEVGGGGIGNENITNIYVNRNGGNGEPSKFAGFGYDINAAGGEGGEIVDGPRGGYSGTPTSGSSLGGGGGTITDATSSVGGIGLNIPLSSSANYLFGGMTPDDWDAYTNQPFRVGGGGNGSATGGDSSYFGGGSQGVQDLMLNERDGGINRGAGGQGGLILLTNIPQPTYRQTRGGHGMVLVMYPKTACNRYLLPSIEQNNLVSWWDTKSTISFSDPLQTTLNDIKRAYNLNYTGSSSTLYNVFTSSLAPIVANQDNTTGSLSTAIWSTGNFSLPPNDYRFEKRITQDFTTTGITMEGWFQYSGGSIENSQLMGISKNDGTAPLLSVVNKATPNSNQTCGIYSSGSATTTAASTLTTPLWYQHTLTYSGTTISYYVNGSLVGTATATIATDLLTNPVFQIGGPFIGGQYNNGVFNFGEVRLYNTALNSTQITSNYNATKARYGR